MLDDIVNSTRMRLDERKRRVPLDDLVRQAGKRPAPRDFAKAISGEGVSIIAEVKKASPSKGVIREDFDPVAIARAYANGGAAAISVLTEEKYFQGSLEYLKSIDNELGDNRPPLLRKDFIVDAYQVYEARAYGADAVLLIVAILTPAELAELLDLTHRLGMTALVEAHDENEVEAAVESGAGVIGINNRDLKTFKVDIKATARLRPLIPADRLVVSESGIATREDIEYLRGVGVDAVLIGEALMTAPDVERRLRELIHG
ncbi:indole-3-glycerol phosphate synthase TrpC [Dehalogenimonas sp. THU2]|uniref:indole-3-glycerol phosphate synthase TrpC n=1 Tax=Dehalogenimonas sp. THU2 TaxID=3151121 RepID=UPI003218C30F